MRRNIRHRLLLALVIAGSMVLCGCVVSAGTLDRDRVKAYSLSRYNQQEMAPIDDWLRLMDLAHDQSRDVKLARVNEFFNSRIVFEDDVSIWQQADYWATPLETLVRGRGDCEDFAIAKYISLLALGIPESSLRLIYVRAQISGAGGSYSQAHMVLGYYADPSSEPQILDNLVGRIERASLRTDLTPVFSFNGVGLWAGGIRADSDPTSRLSRWRDLLRRARDEGLL